jgi:hypothetical protein
VGIEDQSKAFVISTALITLHYTLLEALSDHIPTSDMTGSDFFNSMDLQNRADDLEDIIVTSL